MLNAEWRKATLGSIQHSSFHIQHSIKEVCRSKASKIPIQAQISLGFV